MRNSAEALQIAGQTDAVGEAGKEKKKEKGFKQQKMAVTNKEQHLLLFLDTLTTLNTLNYNSFCNM